MNGAEWFVTSAAIIVAAGRGLRAGGGLPKQWRTVAGRAVMAHTLAAFETAEEIGQIVIVLHPDDMDLRHGYEPAGHVVVPGGQSRAESVRHGLYALQDSGVGKVLIHDVARPCITHDTITAVLDALDHSAGAAPGLPVSDALWQGTDSTVTGTTRRDRLFAAQTPQGFHFDAILAAHDAYEGEAADDVEVARAAGMTVAIVPGDPDNLKITTPQDFARAERILKQNMDIRLGNGFDVHAFGPGGHVTLCGVAVPHTHGLIGHSDADVGMHAVTDAIYGALAQGDIGQHFPPSDPQWKGAASDIFLGHAVQLAAAKGYRISNVDCTLICETPKIGPHAPHMRRVMAQIMGLEEDQVSIKATTSEKLGFTGRSEGIAALATTTLVRE